MKTNANSQARGLVPVPTAGERLRLGSLRCGAHWRGRLSVYICVEDFASLEGAVACYFD